MRTKYIPLIVMLLAGLVVSIVARIEEYTLKPTLWMVVLTMVAFFIIGSIYAGRIRRYEAEAEEREKAEKKAKDEAVSEDGEVIEKDVDDVELQENEE